MWHVHYATSRFLINDGSSVWAIWTFILYFTVMWAPSDPCMYYQASKLRLVASQRKPLILLLFFACKIFPRAPSVHLLVLLYKCFPSVISKLTISSSCKMKKNRVIFRVLRCWTLLFFTTHIDSQRIGVWCIKWRHSIILFCYEILQRVGLLCAKSTIY
jgi:hypothetical protein